MVPFKLKISLIFVLLLWAMALQASTTSNVTCSAGSTNGDIITIGTNYTVSFDWTSSYAEFRYAICLSITQAHHFTSGSGSSDYWLEDSGGTGSSCSYSNGVTGSDNSYVVIDNSYGTAITTGTSGSETVTINVPASVPDGDYYLIIVSDENDIRLTQYGHNSGMHDGPTSNYFTVSSVTNSDPTDITLSPTSIAESNTSGDLIGVLTTTDSDGGDSHTYSLVSGTGDGDNTSATISNDSLFSNAVYDYESKATYNIRIETDDGNGGTYEEAMTFTVSDANDTPTDIILSSSTIYEGLSTGTFIGKFTTTDQDAGDAHTYSFASGGTDNASFTISNDSLFSNAVYDYDTKSSYSIKIRTTDDGTGSLWYEETMGITILEVENVNDFASTMNIYINTTASGTNTSTDLYDMPLLVRLDPSNFTDFGNTNAGGADVRFIKSNNTFLSYEIEFWKDGASDNDTIAFWVKIDTVFGNNSDQYITMIYNKASETSTGNSENVFETTNDFAAVYHLDEEQAGTGTADVYADATANNNDADDYTSATGQDAVIKEGQEFDGTDDYVSIPQSSSLDITGDVTMSGWFKLDGNFTDASTSSEILLTKHKNNDNNMSIALVGTDYDLPLVSDGALAFKVECRDKYSGAYKFVWTSTTSWTAGSWYYFTVVIDADNSANNKIYINGVDDTN